MAENVNSGHRKRMRHAFLNRDFDTMPEHEILEMLLFYAYTRRDTNKIAHRLINHFGSLQGVFDASYEDLVKVDEVGDTAATLLLLFSRLIKKYSRTDYARREYIDNEKLFQMLQARYRDETEEVVVAVFCDHKRRFINMTELSRGSLSEARCVPRDLVTLALRYNANRVILAHNHPSGFAVPSLADIKSTREVNRILTTLDLRLEDHVIVAESECYSMRDSHKFEEIFGC